MENGKWKMELGGIQILASVGILALLVPFVASADPLGGQAGSFLRMGLGADRIAMGDCGVALTGTGMNWFYNPAGLPYQTGKQLSLGYRFLSLDRKMMYVGFTTPLQGNAAIGLNFLRAGTDNIDARDSNGERFDVLSASDNVIAGTFALKPHPRVALGVSIKWMISAIPKILDGGKTLYAYGMGVDLGIRVVATDQLRLGLELRDINAKFNWDATQVWFDGAGAKDDNFPRIVRLGAAYDPIPDLTLTSDVLVNSTDIGVSSDAFRYHFGSEWRASYQGISSFALRGGWNGESPTFGFGVDLPLHHRITARFDYAYAFEKNAPSGSHVIGWTFGM